MNKFDQILLACDNYENELTKLGQKFKFKPTKGLNPARLNPKRFSPGRVSARPRSTGPHLAPSKPMSLPSGSRPRELLPGPHPETGLARVPHPETGPARVPKAGPGTFGEGMRTETPSGDVFHGDVVGEGTSRFRDRGYSNRGGGSRARDIIDAEIIEESGAPTATTGRPTAAQPANPSVIEPGARTSGSGRPTSPYSTSPSVIESGAKTAPSSKFKIEFDEDGKLKTQPEWFGKDGKLKINKKELLEEVKKVKDKAKLQAKLEAKKIKNQQKAISSIESALKRSEMIDSLKSPKAIAGYLALGTATTIFLCLNGGTKAPSSTDEGKKNLVNQVQQNLSFKTFTLSDISKKATAVSDTIKAVTAYMPNDDLSKEMSGMVSSLNNLSAKANAVSSDLNLDNPQKVASYASGISSFEKEAVKISSSIDSLNNTLRINNQDQVIVQLNELSYMLADVVSAIDAARNIQKSGVTK